MQSLNFADDTVVYVHGKTKTLLKVNWMEV